MTKIKIVHCVPSLGVSGGGPPRSVSQLCNALCREADEIGIVTAVDPHDPLVPLAPEIELTGLQSNGNSFFDRLRAVDFGEALGGVHQNTPISLVHQHGIWLLSAHKVVKAASELEIPLVLSPRGMMEAWSMKSKRFKKLIAWHLYQRKDCQRVAAYHATSDLEAESIRRLGLKQPIIVLPNGVLPAPAEPLDPDACRKVREKKTALFLSRINPKKGLPMLLEAWAQLAPSGWELVIAGNDDSDHQPELESIVAKLGLQEVVKFAGPLFDADKDTAFRNADLFVLPTYSENFGIVVAEALAYEVPVVTTTGTPWECLESSKCGWWVEPTIEGICSGLQGAFNCEPERLQEMGRNGKDLVAADYGWEAIAFNMKQAYEWVLNGGDKPAFIRVD